MPHVITDLGPIAAPTARNLFDRGQQQIVPFLGAGVPRSALPPAPSTGSTPPPSPAAIDQIFQALGLTGEDQEARAFIALAAGIALNIKDEAARWNAIAPDALIDPSRNPLLKKLKEDEMPPSASDLAQVLAQLSEFASFEKAVKQIHDLLGVSFPLEESRIRHMLLPLLQNTRIAPDTEPLSAISMYFETRPPTNRRFLLDNLTDVFKNKKTYTPTHDLLARAAGYYLKDKPKLQSLDDPGDYIILTTNYDGLMEIALDTYAIPYVTLAFYSKGRGKPKLMQLRFSQNVPDRESLEAAYREGKPAKDLELPLERTPLVMLYKMHGCLYPADRNRSESVVISDNDYVDFISQMASGPDAAIPTCVSNAIRYQAFMFLGYSLNDWNVRSVFDLVTRGRDKTNTFPDYSVMYSYTSYEKAFFDSKNIVIVNRSLDDFTKAMTDHLPPDLDTLVPPPHA
jgi:hypothetical protein